VMDVSAAKEDTSLATSRWPLEDSTIVAEVGMVAAVVAAEGALLLRAQS
jgi:hypothetical protein